MSAVRTELQVQVMLCTRWMVVPWIALGTRKTGLDTFLEQKVQEGYTIETRTERTRSSFDDSRCSGE